jgi:hypothetical protein
MRVGRVDRVPFAVDDAHLDLLKTFHYLNDPSPQDYRLVTVQRNRISTYDQRGSPVEYDVFLAL